MKKISKLLTCISFFLIFGCETPNYNIYPSHQLLSEPNPPCPTPIDQELLFECTINVTNHGIVPSDENDPANNTEAFKSLMDSLKMTPARCPVIFFPKGTFYGVFNIPSGLNGLSIIGAGHPCTTLKMHPDNFATPGSGGVLTTLGENTSISHLTIDGNGTLAHNTNGYNPNGDGYVCLHIAGDGSTVFETKLTNSYNKQSVVAANNVSITNSYFISNYDSCNVSNEPCPGGMDGDGIHFYGEANTYNTFTIENCFFSGHNRAGIFIEQLITTLNIVNNTFFQCVDGIKQQGKSTAIHIADNYFDHCNRGINSANGLGIMTVDNNVFHIQERAVLIHGGAKFNNVNTNTSLPFTHTFNGQEYQKLGHKIEFINNDIKFVQEPSVAVIDLITYNSNNNQAEESRYNYVQELTVKGNTIDSESVNASPDLIRFWTHDFSDAHGFINKVTIENNQWEKGKMGPFTYMSTQGCLAEVRVLLVRNNTFKNLQGCALYSNYLAFEDNDIYNNPYDAALIRAIHADIYRNDFFADSSNPTRSKRLVINRIFTDTLHQGDNFHYLNNNVSSMVNYDSHTDPCQ